MKIFKKNEFKSFLIKIYKNKNNKLGLIINKSFNDKEKINIPQQQNSKLRINNTEEDKFPSIEENISSLLSELEKNSLEDKNKTQNLYNYIEQKNEILFINNNLCHLENVKLSDLIIINKTYVAKCLAVNNKVSTFVLFDKIK
jgi:hypothetical protein